jgi:cytochrome c biogenesis protein CcdA
MLGSINPLGERARRSRWGVTVAAFAAGAAAAGAAAGAALGALGHAVLGGVAAGPRIAVLAVVVLVGVAADLGTFGLRLPTTRRQVNEDWLGRYRGWVVGLGFGAQLGVGVSTIVTTSAVYAALIGAVLTGSAGGGLLVGVAFGAARAAPLLGAARAADPARVAGIDRRMRSWERPASRIAVAAQVAVATAAVVLAAAA